MTTTTFPLSKIESPSALSTVVMEGLRARPRRLPPWLFYDAAGSQLFDQITELPEYYLTRTERAILRDNAEEMIGLAAEADALRLVELGAGSCDKTRLLLRAAVERQDTVLYDPVDVSESALAIAQERIEREIEGVLVTPRVLDYTRNFRLDPPFYGERRLVLYIGSSIGNFEPAEAHRLLTGIRHALSPGDSILLGVDQVKDERILVAAYDDAAGVTAAFNSNMLARLNRELGANFDLDGFSHRAVWNPAFSRMEMHLVSCVPQCVSLRDIDMRVIFEAGESIHTENSYKYQPGQVQSLLAETGFTPLHTWTDERNWFEVCLGRVA